MPAEQRVGEPYQRASFPISDRKLFLALQGLLRSLGHTSDDSSESSGVTLSTEQLQKLSEKVMEILGDGEDRGLTPGDQPSQVYVLRKCNLLDRRLSNTAPERIWPPHRRHFRTS